MKKIHFLCLAALCLFFSCKKDKSDDASYHVTCKIDGVSSTFNSTAVGALVVEGEDGPALAVTGKTGLSEDADGIMLMIGRTDGTIGTGTYTDKQENVMILGLHLDASSGITYQNGTDLRAEADHYDHIIANPFKIVITAIDDKGVKGTFSGDLYPDAELEGDIKTITEGSFYVALIQP